MSLTAAATEAKKRGPRVPGSVVPKLGTTEKDHYRGARLPFFGASVSAASMDLVFLCAAPGRRGALFAFFVVVVSATSSAFTEVAETTTSEPGQRKVFSHGFQARQRTV
jgi:hypothetical protein